MTGVASNVAPARLGARIVHGRALAAPGGRQRWVRRLCKEYKVALEIDVRTHPLVRLHACRDPWRRLREPLRIGATSLAAVLEHTVAGEMPVAVPA